MGVAIVGLEVPMSVRSPLTRSLALAAIVASFTWLVLLAVQPQWLYVHSPNHDFPAPLWAQRGLLWAPHATSALAVLVATALSVATRKRWLGWLAAISGAAHVVLCGRLAWEAILSQVSFDGHRPLMAIAVILLAIAPACLVGVYAIATVVISAMRPHTAAYRTYAVPMLAVAFACASVCLALAATLVGNARMARPLLTVTVQFLDLMQAPVFAAAMLGIATLGLPTPRRTSARAVKTHASVPVPG